MRTRRLQKTPQQIATIHSPKMSIHTATNVTSTIFPVEKNVIGQISCYSSTQGCKNRTYVKGNPEFPNHSDTSVDLQGETLHFNHFVVFKILSTLIWDGGFEYQKQPNLHTFRASKAILAPESTKRGSILQARIPFIFV